MKTKLLTITMAVIGLVACNKQELIPSSPTPEDGVEGDYMIEITTDGKDTKSSPSTVELNLANLSYASSKSITAQLKKRTSSGWANVTTGVTYAWSASSADSKKFSGSGTNNQTCSVGAISAGSGKINVAASISGSQVANQDVPVTVSDSRAISWTNATTSLTSGETKSATLNCNFSGTVTVSSNNSDFLVGTSTSNLAASASVTFSSGTTKTIYYKYTGSSETTVTVNANSNCCFAYFNLEVIPISEQDVRKFWEEQIHNYFEYEYEDVMFTAPIRTFPWSDWELRYVFIDWDSEFGTSVWSAYYDDATQLNSLNGNSLIKTYMSSIQY